MASEHNDISPLNNIEHRTVFPR